MTQIPPEVAAAYGVDASQVELVPSLINQTFFVGGGEHRFVLQCLHPVFQPSVNLDLQAVTLHLAAHGLETPLLKPTIAGAAWCVDGSGKCWRAIAYMEGIVVHELAASSARARSAGNLVGRFHRALSTLQYDFVHCRPAAHDTRAHLARLERTREIARDTRDTIALEIATEVLEHAQGIKTDFESFPRRVCHGDLKISNILFFGDQPWRARCLIDLDTLGEQYLAYEIGDALRSWCNASGENDKEARFDQDVFRAALAGYLEPTAGVLSLAELLSTVDGLETICVELAARFCVDMVENAYFGWDSQRFSSRREHNSVRARSQLALARVVRKQKPALGEIARQEFAQASR